MAEVIWVSDAQLRFVTNSQSGMGLLKFGNAVIPLIIRLERIQAFISCITQIFTKKLRNREQKRMLS